MKIETLLEHKVVAVIRHANADNILPVVKALMAGGVKAIEITVENPGGLEAIKVIAQSKLDVCLGAGTVMDGLMSELAIQAGASFLVAPVCHEAMIKVAHKHHVLAIPGVLTPNEIVAALALGADMVKIFPISSMGVSYLKTIKAPLPNVAIMVTGGVSLENAKEYLEHANMVGIGSQLIDLRKELTSDYLKQITINARQVTEGF